VQSTCLYNYKHSLMTQTTHTNPKTKVYSRAFNKSPRGVSLCLKLWRGANFELSQNLSQPLKIQNLLGGCCCFCVFCKNTNGKIRIDTLLYIRDMNWIWKIMMNTVPILVPVMTMPLRRDCKFFTFTNKFRITITSFRSVYLKFRNILKSSNQLFPCDIMCKAL
jgi:hypothetical protein